MGLLDDFRIDIADDGGVIPSGGFPSGVSPLPPLAQPTLLSDLRVDTADDDGLIPSGIVQGIAVHDLLSIIHPDTTPASPVAGDLIIGGATWRKLSRGTSGQFLTVSGTTLVWTNIEPIVSGIAIALIATHAADPNAHHTRYTDAEASDVASGLIVTHTAESGAHHSRYTDSEAIAAVTPLIPSGFLVAILSESGVELTANATTTSVLPILSTLLSVPIDLIIPSGNLRIMATASINANGPIPVVFHIYIDGVFHRGTTVNVTGAIDNASIVIPRVATSGSNPHTVELRWAKFASPFVTVSCLPATLPDFFHASISVQEIL